MQLFFKIFEVLHAGHIYNDKIGRYLDSAPLNSSLLTFIRQIDWIFEAAVCFRRKAANRALSFRTALRPYPKK